MRDAPRWLEPLRAAIAAAAVALFCALLLAFEPGLFWQDDNQLGALPGFFEVARALDQGEWPLLSLKSWQAGNFAGELQLGLFSVFIMPLVWGLWKLELTLPATAALYTVVHLMVLAAGTWMLARRKGVPVWLAGVPVAAASLNGWNIVWSGATWLSLLTSFAWLPWAWWALERGLEPHRGPWRFLPAAGFLYLLAAAGWPPTVFMALLVAAMIAGRDWRAARSPLRLWPIAAAFAVAGAVVLPAYWLFWIHVSHSARIGASGPVLEWLVPLRGWLGLLYPGDLSMWRVYAFDRLHFPIEMANGTVPAIAVLAALAWRREALFKRAGWELGLLAIALVLCMLPGFSLFRWSFRWLPLVHLTLGLAGGLALAAWFERRPEGRLQGNMGLWALALVGLTACLSGSQSVISPWLPAGLVAAAAAWLVVEAVGPERLRRWAPLLVVVASLWLTYRHIPVALHRPVWPMPEAIRQPAPLDPSVRYMAFAHRDDYFGEAAFQRPFGVLMRPGCSYLYAGLDFVNGYSPLGPRGLQRLLLLEVNGYMNLEVSTLLLARETGPDGLLALMGVDGIFLGGAHLQDIPSLAARGWTLVARGPEGAIMHRAGPPSPRVRAVASAVTYREERQALADMMERAEPAMPVVLTGGGDAPAGPRRYAPARVTPLSSERTREDVAIQVPPGADPALVLFSRAWYPGFIAELDGRPMPVRLANMTMPAVEVPPGASGTLSLIYRPWQLLVGGAVSLGTIGLLLAAALCQWLLRLVGRASPAA